MDSLTRKAMDDLEFNRILDAVRALCRTPLGSAELDQRELLDNAAEISAELSLVSEQRALLVAEMPPPFSGVESIAPLCNLLAKDAVLEPSEFIAIGTTVRAAALLRHYYQQQAERAPRVATMACELADLSDLSDHILRTFNERGEIADEASETLHRLRRREIALRETLRLKMEKLATSDELAPLLQDNYFTVREDRYVLPLKSSFKPSMEGIIHGTSQTGQTVFIEPAEMIRSNNELKVLQQEIRQEEYRILRELAQQVRLDLQPIRENLTVIARLDYISARAAFSVETGSHPPQVIDDGDLALLNARNPLLVLAGVKVIPNHVRLLHPARMLIISGPNAGGKTVTLSTVGLCALMIRHGMHIPASADSQLPVFPRILSVMGDLQDIDMNLSTFTGHINRIGKVMNSADERSLVLIDEIAVGTEPQQGAALAVAMLETLADKKVCGLVTTHYNRLKTVSLVDERFMNASVTTDPDSHNPTYKLSLGTVGQSHPFEIAQQAGLDGSIIARARILMGDNEQSLQKALDNLDKKQADVEQELQRQREANRELEQEKRRLAAEREEIRIQATRLIEQDAQKTLKRLEELREAIRQRTRELQQAESHTEVRGQRRKIREIADEIQQLAPTAEPAEEAARQPLEHDTIKAGLTVWVESFQSVGQVATAPDHKGRVAVVVGTLKITTTADDLFEAPKAAEKPKQKRSRVVKPTQKRRTPSRLTVSPAQSSENTLDLRGTKVDDALDQIDKFLDQKVLANKEAVYLIHGHGTGALKKAVREWLKSAPAVENYHPAEPSRGGDGVTLVWLA